MDILIQAILPFVLIYKYWALFTLTFLASLAIPIPAGTILIASAAFASQGYFNITTIFIVVIIANIAGDNVSYWLARLYGKKVFSYIKFTKKILESDNFRLIEKVISRRSGFIVFISRFEVLSTLSINIICGLGKVTYKKFMIFEIMGSFVNVIFFIIIGYFFGNSWQAINKLIGNFSIFFILFVFLILSIFWKKIIKILKKEEQS